MCQGRSWLLVSVLFSATCLVRVDADQVGDLGDFSRFKFHGVKTYSADDLIGALQISGDSQFAAHATAPLDKFLAAVESFIQQGYRNGGFAQPVVRATVDESRNRVVVTVTEGPRYVQGEILISGGKGLPLDALRKCLLDPESIGSERLVIHSADDFPASSDESNTTQSKQQDKKDSPKWEPGKHLRFDKRLYDTWGKRLDSVLRDFGYIDAKIELELNTNDNSKTADLVIKVVDPGRPIRVGRIEVRGLKRNTRDQLLDYLNVTEGMRLDARIMGRIDERLYSAGRFISHEVSLVRGDEDGPVLLVVEVLELPDAPLLSEEFNERQVTFLRVGRWLEDWESRAAHMKCHVRGDVPQAGGPASLDFSISPDWGLTGSFQAELFGRKVQYGLALAKERVAIYNAQRQRCYDTPPFMWTKVDLLVYLVSDEGEIKNNLKFNYSASSSETGPTPLPLLLEVRIAPVMLIHQTTQPDTVWKEVENGLTTAQFEKSTITFDSRTGAVHEILEESESFHFQLTFELDKTAAPREDFSARYFGLRNEHRADYPTASFVGFVVGEVLWNAQADEQNTEALIRRTDVLTNLIAEKLGSALRSNSSDDEDDQAEKFHSPHPTSIPLTTDYRVLLAICGPAAAEKLFPRESWPWVLLREAAFSAQGRSQYTMDEVQRLLKDPDVGPVGCLVLAKMMTMVGAKKLSHQFATKGLDDLTLEGFRRDLDLFTSGEKSAPKLLAAGVDVMRSLSLEEVTTVCELLKKPDLTRQVQGIRKFLTADDRPGDQLLALRLESMWEPVLRGRLEQSLKQNLLEGIRRDSPFQP